MAYSFLPSDREGGFPRKSSVVSRFTRVLPRLEFCGVPLLGTISSSFHLISSGHTKLTHPNLSLQPRQNVDRAKASTDLDKATIDLISRYEGAHLVGAT